MNSEEEIFENAAALPESERIAYLDAACAGNPEMRARLEALLRSHEVTGFMEGGTALSPVALEQAGEKIGRYRLLQQIGEGGFGVVWMAEQVEPVTRRVALKIIKAGMDTREVIARFEAERQALAMMDHPNIARVFDAGATDKGRPFFVMELVKGIPITKFCDEQEFTARQRLELFADVCSAINHAHQKGIIHRDIKPSNVMVTLHGEKPVTKVIDFGIAKATQGRLADRTLFTRFEQFIGTPAYMSPEQTTLSGLDIDTRSDIYALGILLYELLTGKPPFDARSLLSAGYEEMRRIIREQEPPRPSSRLSTAAGEERATLAKMRHVPPEKLSRLVEPDIDWIVMKAIEKDRTRRYETANGLAQDIRRFLADEPVSATPPSAGYRFRKFARRNKIVLSVLVSFATVLITAAAVSLKLSVRATDAEKLAKSQAERANQALKFYLWQASERKAPESSDDLDMRARELAMIIDATGWSGLAVSKNTSLVHYYLQFQRWNDALQLMHEWEIHDPFDKTLMLQLCAAEAWLGKESDCIATCRRMIETHATYRPSVPGMPVECELAAACCLLPCGDPQLLRKGRAFALRASEAYQQLWYHPHETWRAAIAAADRSVIHLGLGIAEFRCGSYSAADVALTTAEKENEEAADNVGEGKIPRSITIELFRAMTLFRNGQPQEGRALFAAAKSKMGPLPADERPFKEMNRPNMIIRLLAYKEARGLLEFDK